MIGADVVEYNPDRDLNGMTAAVCVKLMKELGRGCWSTKPSA